MDIRKTLKATQAATFAVLLPSAAHSGMPVPTGTGFFVSSDGLFVTARHVVADDEGAVRSDIDQVWLQKEMREFSKPMALCQSGSLVFDDQATDVAVLRIDFVANSNNDWLKDKKGFPYLRVSAKQLDEGESVYAFGYPLASATVNAGPGIIVGTGTLRPRVTSAIVASTLEEAGPVQSGSDPVNYVLDKALNYGNSGGPIIATETGRVGAICTRFQPVAIRQPQLDATLGANTVVWIPSLYGVVTAMTNVPIRKFLESEGVSFV
jgi:serine protease Do